MPILGLPFWSGAILSSGCHSCWPQRMRMFALSVSCTILKVMPGQSMAFMVNGLHPQSSQKSTLPCLVSWQRVLV